MTLPYTPSHYFKFQIVEYDFSQKKFGLLRCKLNESLFSCEIVFFVRYKHTKVIIIISIFRLFSYRKITNFSGIIVHPLLDDVPIYLLKFKLLSFVNAANGRVNE